MTTTDTERYVRITLLTFEGGSWISKKILYRELDKTAGLTVAALLNSNKDSLKRKRSSGDITKKQFDILFPRSGADTDVEEWDLSLLVKIVWFLFSSSLNGQETTDLNEILKIRNDVVCHARQPSIQEREFFLYRTKLTVSIQRLAFGFDNDTNQYADDLIAKLLRGPLDLQTSMDKLAQLCRNDEHMESVLASLSRLEITQNQIMSGISTANAKLDALVDGVKKLLNIHESDDEQCKVEIPILDSKVCIVGKKEDVVKLAEDIVLKVLKSAVNKVDDPANDENVKTAVKQFLEDIEAKDAVAVSAHLGSIILNIQCLNLHGLEHMLSWFLSSNNEYRLYGIEHVLNDMFKEEMQVFLVLPDQTMGHLLAWLADTLLSKDGQVFKKEIPLGIKFLSADAVSQVLKYLNSAEPTNILNQLSEALSEVVEGNVKVEMKVDLEGFQRSLKHTGGPKPGPSKPELQDHPGGARYDSALKRKSDLPTAAYPVKALKGKDSWQPTEKKLLGTGAEPGGSVAFMSGEDLGPKVREGMWRKLTHWAQVAIGRMGYLKYYGLWHAVLITDVDSAKSTIRAIHYGTPSLLGTRTVMEETFHVQLDRGDLWAYDLPHVGLRSPEESIARGRMLLGEQKFCMFTRRSYDVVLECLVKDPSVLKALTK